MDAHDQIVPGAQQAQHTSSIRDEPCANCAERTYLKILVAELLYKNQELRFELMTANQQLEHFKRIHAGVTLSTKTQQQSQWTASRS
jgi:hypothetical protein